ncbi:alcohol dehydrogenase cytochrome c subunit [Caballeronia choica]|jgi:hypothetical protein|uniref:Alcohol dehydrogenase cytochrome c subunit n=1 Tax=Caballeronia choica TaxID=326476 RepID=A0A158L5N5_9BURK|nr:hypothetical protein [Caballeronia choica]SAL88666.1 alcohol dehydrogenase cytochrome c subunit [Caballeronia choica]
MPAFEKKLTSEEVAQVLTFVRGTWGNSAVPVTVRQGLRCAMGLSAADLISAIRKAAGISWIDAFAH